MQACASILQPSPIFTSFFFICFCLFAPFWIILKTNTWTFKKIYTAWYFGGYQYFSNNKRSFPGPSWKSTPIKMCIVMQHSMPPTPPTPHTPSLCISKLYYADKCVRKMLSSSVNSIAQMLAQCKSLPSVHVHTQRHTRNHKHTHTQKLGSSFCWHEFSPLRPNISIRLSVYPHWSDSSRQLEKHTHTTLS